MRVAWTWAFLFLLLVVCASAESQTNSDGLSVAYPKASAYPTGVPVTLEFSVFNSSGAQQSNASTSCNFTLYNPNGSVNVSGALPFVAPVWRTTLAGIAEPGERAYTVACLQAGVGGFVSSKLRFTIDGQDEAGADLWPVAALVLVPLLFGFLCVAGASLFTSEDHDILKIFLFLLAIVSPLASLLFATEAVIKFYDWTAATDTITFYVYVLGGVFIAVFFYWLMYAFYVMVTTIAEKKAKRLEA